MKKSLLFCLLALGLCIGLYAESTEDTQFKQYVELTKNDKENPEGMTVAADCKYRIVYVAMPIPTNMSAVTPETIAELKADMIKEMRSEKDECKVVRDLKISFVYSFITSDRRVIAIPVSYKDL